MGSGLYPNIVIFGIAAGMTARMYYLYQNNNGSQCDIFMIILSIFSVITGISVYCLMYWKFVKNKRPAVAVPVERWVTVNPFLTIMICVSYLTSVVLLSIGLWPVFKFSGVLFSIAMFILFNRIASYSPF